MPQINLLSREISELIAAGEVIEKPASVIKELVENAVDSGAKHISVEIKNGGITYMRVADDGCGIANEDVPTAFLRHATSKIEKVSDLDSVMTLGFRGEALASISAVSKVEVMTRRKQDDYGTIYKIDGGEEVSNEKSGCPVGTSMVVRDLFYNVPVRLKFLGKDVTEANAVSSIVRKIAISHPEISFTMIRDNRNEFTTSGDGKIFSAIYSVLGKDFARDMIECHYEYNGTVVRGYIIKPLYARKNRAFQNFFVNGRYVSSKVCMYALENAYRNLIMTGKFPACVLMIEVSPETVDVNIHPSKAEVRFSDEKNISDAIFFAVKSAMSENGLIYEFETDSAVTANAGEVRSIPEKSTQFQAANRTFETERAEKKTVKADTVQERLSESDTEKVTHRESVTETKKPEKSERQPDYTFTPPTQKDFDFEQFSKFMARPEKEVVPEPEKIQTPPVEDIKIVGEVFGLYVICECGDELIIIDKHASHERIIFEQLKERNKKNFKQNLLVGVRVLLTEEEFGAIEDNYEICKDMGFEFDFSERPLIIATAVPDFAVNLTPEEIITEIADNLLNHLQNPQTTALDDMYHSLACKSAVRANDRNSPEEMKALVNKILTDERIRHCPHGRPVMFVMKKSSIDRQFRRT